ncbi:MAG: transposase [Campylobacterota bacterium]|nr:transposase [Campylobacterota bacterium]
MKQELNSIENPQEIIIKQAQENSSQKEQIQTLLAQNKYMQERIDQLTRMLFKSKSEKFNSNQPHLFTVEDSQENIEVEEDKEIEIAFKRKKGGRTSPPKDLPRKRVEQKHKIL